MALPDSPLFDDSAADSILPFPSMTEPGHWGAAFEHRTFTTQGPVLPAHITTERVGTVEGLLAIVRCWVCGGRYERLLDFRDLANCTPDRVRPALDAMEAGARVSAMRWASDHLACTTAPRPHLASSEVERLLQEQFSTAAADIRAGEPLSNELLVLMSDQSILRLPLEELPDSRAHDNTWTRMMAIHLFHAAVREHARMTRTRPMAAVVVGELSRSMLTVAVAAGPARTGNVSEPEALTIMAATPEAVMLGTARITRESGVRGIGPGELSPLTFDLLRTASSLTEGLFATS
jgi:hypothetical protein